MDTHRRSVSAAFRVALFVLASGICAPIVQMEAQSTGNTRSNAARWPTHVWSKATPASVGLDDKILAALDADLTAASTRWSIALPSFAAESTSLTAPIHTTTQLFTPKKQRLAAR